MFRLISDLYSPRCQSISLLLLLLLNRWGTIAVASDDLITAMANSNWSEAQTRLLCYPLSLIPPNPHLYLKLAGFRCHFLFGLQSKESNEREQKKENNVDNVRDPQPSRFTQSEKEKERGDRCKNLLWDTFAIFPSRSTRYTHTLAHVSTHTVKKVKKGKLTKRVQRGYAAWTIEAQNWVVPSALPFPIIPPPFCCLVAWAADGWLTGKLKARN